MLQGKIVFTKELIIMTFIGSLFLALCFFLGYMFGWNNGSAEGTRACTEWMREQLAYKFEYTGQTFNFTSNLTI